MTGIRIYTSARPLHIRNVHETTSCIHVTPDLEKVDYSRGVFQVLLNPAADENTREKASYKRIYVHVHLNISVQGTGLLAIFNFNAHYYYLQFHLIK